MAFNNSDAEKDLQEFFPELVVEVVEKEKEKDLNGFLSELVDEVVEKEKEKDLLGFLSELVDEVVEKEKNAIQDALGLVLSSSDDDQTYDDEEEEVSDEEEKVDDEEEEEVDDEEEEEVAEEEEEVAEEFEGVAKELEVPMEMEVPKEQETVRFRKRQRDNSQDSDTTISGVFEKLILPPLAKRSSTTSGDATPVAQAPLAQAPLAQVPLAKAPIPEDPVAAGSNPQKEVTPSTVAQDEVSLAPVTRPVVVSPAPVTAPVATSPPSPIRDALVSFPNWLRIASEGKDHDENRVLYGTSTLEEVLNLKLRGRVHRHFSTERAGVMRELPSVVPLFDRETATPLRLFGSIENDRYVVSEGNHRIFAMRTRKLSDDEKNMQIHVVLTVLDKLVFSMGFSVAGSLARSLAVLSPVNIDMVPPEMTRSSIRWNALCADRAASTFTESEIIVENSNFLVSRFDDEEIEKMRTCSASRNSATELLVKEGLAPRSLKNDYLPIQWLTLQPLTRVETLDMFRSSLSLPTGSGFMALMSRAATVADAEVVQLLQRYRAPTSKRLTAEKLRSELTKISVRKPKTPRSKTVGRTTTLTEISTFEKVRQGDCIVFVEEVSEQAITFIAARADVDVVVVDPTEIATERLNRLPFPKILARAKHEGQAELCYCSGVAFRRPLEASKRRQTSENILSLINVLRNKKVRGGVDGGVYLFKPEA